MSATSVKGHLAPFRKMAVTAALLLGTIGGLGAYILNYAAATSYLSDDPKACINCHVMRDQFEAWNHSNHKTVAVCNDCHAPRGFADKWLAKGINGWNHGFAFTTGVFQDPIRIQEFNINIVQSNCVFCHQRLVSEIHHSGPKQQRLCFDCHAKIGHGR